MSKYLILSDIPRHTVVRFILLFFQQKSHISMVERALFVVYKEFEVYEH